MVDIPSREISVNVKPSYFPAINWFTTVMHFSVVLTSKTKNKQTNNENEYLAEHIRCNISFLVCALFSIKLMKLT